MANEGANLEGPVEDVPFYECDTVDLAAPEYYDKLIVTNEAQTEILLIADSLDEISEAAVSKSFQAKLKKYGQHAQYVIHNSQAVSPSR